MKHGPNVGCQSHNIHVTDFVLNACKLDLCMLKGLQSIFFGMSGPWNKLKPSHQSHLWLNRTYSLG